MVETACENNDERVDSDSDKIDELRKGMVIAILADDPNYEYYLQKLTTGSELIEQNFSDSWSGTSDHGSRIIRGWYYDKVQSQPFLFQLIPRKTAACYSATICFICAELEGDTVTVQEELHLDILQSLDTRIQSIKEMLS